MTLHRHLLSLCNKQHFDYIIYHYINKKNEDCLNYLSYFVNNY